MIEEFERHLRGTNLSENTISSYLFALRQYSSQYDGITKKNLRAYKVWLIENYKPKTVNLRLRAINCQVDLSICNSCLHCNETKRPLFCYGRRNKLKLDILFSHLPFR